MGSGGESLSQMIQTRVDLGEQIFSPDSKEIAIPVKEGLANLGFFGSIERKRRSAAGKEFAKSQRRQRARLAC